LNDVGARFNPVQFTRGFTVGVSSVDEAENS
jgi:hypothetical protein